MASLFAIERQGKKVLLATDLTFEQLSKIAEQLPHCENVCLSTHFKRHYPHATVASHIVGYLGQYDFEASGKMGLEKSTRRNSQRPRRPNVANHQFAG